MFTKIIAQKEELDLIAKRQLIAGNSKKDMLEKARLSLLILEQRKLQES